jgi:hypothetical protein
MPALQATIASPRFIDCPNCDGGGRALGHRAITGDPDGPDLGRCFICGGDGELEIETVPITLEDLEELAAP